MKAKQFFLGLAAVTISGSALTETIAVSQLSMEGVKSTSLTAEKCARLELVKLGIYQVLDEFDMIETLKKNPKLQDCNGVKCLTTLGEKLGVDFILTGSVEGLGNKFAVSLKLIKVDSKSIEKAHSIAFENMEIELQRMIGMVLTEMHGMETGAMTKKALLYRCGDTALNNFSARSSGRIN